MGEKDDASDLLAWNAYDSLLANILFLNRLMFAELIYQKVPIVSTERIDCRPLFGHCKRSLWPLIIYMLRTLPLKEDIAYV